MQRISINMSDNTKIYGSGKNAMCPNCSWQDIGTALYNGSNEMRPICSWSFYNGTTHFGRQESLAPRSATSSGKKKKLCSMMRCISYILEFDWYQYTYIHIYIYVDIHHTGCPKKMTKRKQILSKSECCGAKFSYEHDLGALDPA